MNTKTTRIVSISMMAIPCLVLISGGVMKLLGAEPPSVMQFLISHGFGNYINVLGLMELIIAALLLYSKTNKLGFLLASSYLSGAFALELSAAMFPASVLFIILLWVAMFLKHKEVFLSSSPEEQK